MNDFLFVDALNVQNWTYILVGISFALYIGIAIWSRANSTKEFYIAGRGVSPVANGMATAADWMSAASFISMVSWNSKSYILEIVVCLGQVTLIESIFSLVPIPT